MLKISRSTSLMMLAGFLCVGTQVHAVDGTNITSSVTQQTTKVTGTVTDDLGPVAGASVVIKGTTTGSITDMDGNFSLPAKPGDVIQISFIGYVTQDIKFTGQSSINVKLIEDTQKLDEVVVTALGMKRSEKALGYAVTELKSEDLTKVSINPVASLQGKVAGVEIAGSDGGMFGGTKIQIRGASTLSGNNQPIYVVDGVILDNSTSGTASADWNSSANDYGNELKNLNPDDFETVSVLKGAAATALYGSRGLNGAVVITTKGGGKFKGFGVSVTQSFGFDHVFDTPSLQNEYGPGNWSGTVSYGETLPDGSYNKWDNANQFKLNTSGKPTLIGASSNYWGPKYDGREIELYDGEMGVYEAYKNNYKDMYKVGFNSNTNVAIQGGSEKTSYYSSISYRYANGTLPNNSFERLSMLLKASHKISERVDVAASVNIASSLPRNAQPNIGEYFAGGTYGRSYDPNYYKDKYLGEHGGLASTSYGDKYGNVPGKGLWFSIYNNDKTQKETVIRPTMEVNVKITDWIRFKAEGNMNYYYTKGEEKQLGSGYANEGGYYGLWQNTKEQTTLAGSVFVNKDISDFNIGGFARFEYWNNKEQANSSWTDGGLIVPGQYFLDNSKQQVKTSGKISNTKRMLSAVVALSLSWRNQVFLDITGRNDWSSALVYTNRTGNYSYFYPSVSGSWLINETLDLPEWISLAKIRGSWAQVGNDTSPYSINQGYGLGNIVQSSGNIYTNSVPTTMYDPSLKPERKNAFEVGLDWRFLNGRIGIDATYYKENTKDQILEISVPSVSGIAKQKINAGNIQNQGVEISLNTVPYQNKDWEWTLDFTYTKNENKIIELHENVQSYLPLVGDVAYGNFRVGSVAKINGAYGLLMTDALPTRNENGDIVLAWNNSGRVAYEQRSGKIQELGKLTPDFLGSLSTGLRYKDISLRVLFDMRFGGIVASYNNRYGTAYGFTETSLRGRDEAHGGVTWTSQYADSKGMTFHDGIIPEGVFADGTKVTTPDGRSVDVSGMHFRDAYEQGLVEPVHASIYHRYRNDWGLGTVNDDWVHELKYIALREITLGYRVPKTIASKVGAKNINLAFSARNLGYLYNSLPNNLNPEGVRGNDAREFRERSFSPYTANYMFTIGLDF